MTAVAALSFQGSTCTTPRGTCTVSPDGKETRFFFAHLDSELAVDRFVAL